MNRSHFPFLPKKQLPFETLFFIFYFFYHIVEIANFSAGLTMPHLILSTLDPMTKNNNITGRTKQREQKRKQNLQQWQTHMILQQPLEEASFTTPKAHITSYPPAFNNTKET